MKNYLNSLDKKYEIGIKTECENKRLNLLTCLSNNNNDDFVCHYEKINFIECIKEFDKDFRKKFKININK